MTGKAFIVKRTIAAPPDLIYLAFTNANALTEWLCDLALAYPHPGGRLYMQWRDGRARFGTYVSLTHGKKLTFDWRGDEEDDFSQVSIALAEKDDVTTLTLSESSESKGWSKRAAQAEAFWNTALDNLVSVLETGTDQRERPYLGLEVSPLEPGEEGVRVIHVFAESPAHQAGVHVGDVITAIGNERVTDVLSYDAALHRQTVGARVKLAFARNGKKLSATVTLAKAPSVEIPDSHEALAEIVARKYTEVNRDLTQALKGVSDERAARAPAPGQWSARQVLAHLIESERYLHHWLTCLIAGEALIPEWPPTGMRERLDAVINGFPTVQALLTELKRNEAETVALLNALPPAFLARKASYRRLAEVVLDWPNHAREHLEQIKHAVRHAKAFEAW
ncbi:MAG: PDZ domain-containing protein [Thermoflexales bacterium]|nr:PDZ domain-containing protein [Thermoflexales bacterium]MCS7324507.1 PDZ domain-containing protein [Thermoflexales bacterium]MCX7938500.1 PDZ domain-containing protein [Thermoflexales bacterium]MDW8054236.1 PDZ domain-containing protein [Anaerolineae bacterium]MDW8292244.1 PDZ domain-containing protein [Anaerolineae bacterium]